MYLFYPTLKYSIHLKGDNYGFLNFSEIDSIFGHLNSLRSQKLFNHLNSVFPNTVKLLLVYQRIKGVRSLIDLPRLLHSFLPLPLHGPRSVQEGVIVTVVVVLFLPVLFFLPLTGHWK